MIRVCLDTNILISAVVFGGKPKEILDLVQEEKIQAVLSPTILMEMAEVLEDKFDRSQDEIITIVKMLAEVCEVVRSQHKFSIIDYNPDNRILEAAFEGRVDYIVTGDKKHLLPLRQFKNIPIITPDEFLKIYGKLVD